jgi:hypothetical protein
MPPRANLFQDVVAIVQRSMGGTASVEESAMLRSRATGDLREVDVVVRSTIAGHDVSIGVEASRTGRRRSVEWVEQLISKHSELPTDKLILVSAAGVSKAARRLADAKGVVVIVGEDMTDDDVTHDVINKLRSIWPRTIRIEFLSCELVVQGPASQIVIREAPFDFNIVSPAGREIGHLQYTLTGIVEDNWPLVIHQLEAYGIEETAIRDLDMQVQNPLATLNGVQGPICLHWTSDEGVEEYHPIISLAVKGKCHISVQEIELAHIRLGEVGVAYGRVDSDGTETTFVATASEGNESLYIRTRTPGASPETIELHPLPDPPGVSTE